MRRKKGRRSGGKRACEREGKRKIQFVLAVLFRRNLDRGRLDERKKSEKKAKLKLLLKSNQIKSCARGADRKNTK